jgi:hypothetical protein
MKFNIKQFAIFALLAYLSYLLSGYLTPMIPSTGNQLVTQGIVFLVPLLVLWLVWINYGQKTAEDVAKKV